MSLTERTRSILMQVAYKEAAEDFRNGTASDVKAQAAGHFSALLELFADFDINDNVSPAAVAEEREGAVVTINGEQWVDYRELKKQGLVDPNFPDFKSMDNKRSEWLFTKDGQSKRSKFAESVFALEGETVA